MLRFKHNMGWVLSLLTALVPPLRRKPLISSLFCSDPAVFAHRVDRYLLMLRIFDVRREALHRGESLSHQWPQNLPPISLLEFKFKQLGWIVFVPLFLFLWLQSICSLLSSLTSQWKLRRIFKYLRDILCLTISSGHGQLSIRLMHLCIIKSNKKSYIPYKCKFICKIFWSIKAKSRNSIKAVESLFSSWTELTNTCFLRFHHRLSHLHLLEGYPVVFTLLLWLMNS